MKHMSLLAVWSAALLALGAWPAQAGLKVVTTVPDLAVLARAVGGEHVEVTCLSLPTQDSHFVDARPHLALDLNRADLLVAVGLQLEVGWLPTLQQGARNPRILIGSPGYLEVAQFVRTLEVPSAPIGKLLLLPGLLLTGCAWGPGEGFTVVEPWVRVAWAALPSRDVGGGYQQLATDYQVRVTRASMELGTIELMASSGGGSAGGTGGTFDPSNPPPGYSLCHNGHCHRDDGALIPYEEIAAGGGGAVTSQRVIALPVGQVDLLSLEQREVPCEPGCELPRTQVSKGRWPLMGLSVEGTVRDSRPEARFTGERPFRLRLAPADAEKPVMVLEGAMDLASDRSSPARVKLELGLELTAALFDGVEWSTAARDAEGVVDLESSANATARESLLTQLTRLSPEARSSDAR